MDDIKVLELWTTEIDSDVNEAFSPLGYEVREIINPSGDPVGKKAILKDGNVVAIVGMNHKLIPNEVLQGYVEEVVKELGAVLFEERRTPTQYLASYYLPEEEKVPGPRGELRLGFTVANSIDGSIAMKVMGFTFRSICENGAIYGLRDVTQYFRLHTAGFLQEFLDGGVAMIRDAIVEVLNSMEDVMRVMEEWPRITVNSPEGRKLLGKIRKSHLPYSLRPKYALPEDHPQVEVPGDDVTVWDLYNDITAAITREAEDVRPASVLDYYSSLHKALLVVEVEE